MNRDAMITVKGKQRDLDGEESSIELVTEGKYYKKGKCYYIVYKETEISGMEGTTTTLKLEDERITLIRFGNSQVQMIFDKNKIHKSRYKTIYGILNMDIHTKDLTIDANDDKAHLYVNYDMAMDEEMRFNNTLTVTVR